MFTQALSIGQWAWEFLRRNREYQANWKWFWSTWQTLEARYGKPPERDFQSWKRDPDAYRVVDDAAGECRVDQDRVLIECWMGEKWGFYKFPLDPATEQPLIGEQLSWRELLESAHVVASADSPYLGGRAGYIALGFELDLPLRRQLETVKRFLQARQAKLRRDGDIVMRTVASQRDRWTLMLRLLDGLQAGEAPEEVCASLQEQLTAVDAVGVATELLGEAEHLVNGGYRELLRIPG